MTTVTSHAPGSFCWIELATSDAEAARAFYTGVFGWTVNEIPMGEHGNYYIFQQGGRDVAAMYRDTRGNPPNWLSYVSVGDADATAAQAKSLGATVLADPFDVYELGRMAVLSDPQGGVFALWQPKSHIGIGLRDQANALCWNELQARDVEAARNFYPPLFGWRMKASDEYTEWHLAENAVGGMLPSQAPPEVPSFWLPYFAVSDCEQTFEKGESLGGHGIVPPTDIPNVGRFAVLADPQGAVFAVIRLSM